MTHLSIIDGLINQWINFIDRLINCFFLHFLSKNKYFIFIFSRIRTLYSSRTLRMQKKYWLSIEASTLRWKGEVDGALDPWFCFTIYAMISQDYTCTEVGYSFEVGYSIEVGYNIEVG